MILQVTRARFSPSRAFVLTLASIALDLLAGSFIGAWFGADLATSPRASTVVYDPFRSASSTQRRSKIGHSLYANITR